MREAPPRLHLVKVTDVAWEEVSPNANFESQCTAYIRDDIHQSFQAKIAAAEEMAYRLEATAEWLFDNGYDDKPERKALASYRAVKVEA